MEDHKEKFTKLNSFLSQYQEMIHIEFLKQYPRPYPDFMLPWLKELSTWDFSQLAQLESHPHEDLVEDSSFKQFLNSIRNLSKIDRQKIEETKLDSNVLRKLNSKKCHELQTIKTLFDKSIKTTTILDVGGGMGHLSCALLSGTYKKSLCLDMNKKLQVTGREKIEKWLFHLNNQIIFKEIKFDNKSSLTELAISPKETLIIGLHGCGELSNDIVKFSVKNNFSKLMSFGCCYHKLDPNFHLSVLAKENPIHFSSNALHLAGRSGVESNAEDLAIRYQFKRYRYSLHYFLYDNFKIPFYALGNSAKSDYTNDFSHYAKKYHQGDELDNITNKALEDFYNEATTKEKVTNNYLADTIRLLMGRLIELYIVLDRAIYLEENNFQPKISEVFNRKLSPRNILVEY